MEGTEYCNQKTDTGEIWQPKLLAGLYIQIKNLELTVVVILCYRNKSHHTLDHRRIIVNPVCACAEKKILLVFKTNHQIFKLGKCTSGKIW